MDTDSIQVRAGAKTILVVDDSPVQVLTLMHLLEQKGLSVLCASNGLAGVAMAEKFHPDLIVLDVQMPLMDGLEACRQLKANPSTAAIPIVLFTGQSEAEVVIEGIENGAVDFVPKDAFSEIVLLKTLQQLELLPPDASVENAGCG